MAGQDPIGVSCDSNKLEFVQQNDILIQTKDFLNCPASVTKAAE